MREIKDLIEKCIHNDQSAQENLYRLYAYAWFKTISATQLDNAKTTDGVIIISETSNSAIFDEVADNLDYTTQAIFE